MFGLLLDETAFCRTTAYWGKQIATERLTGEIEEIAMQVHLGVKPPQKDNRSDAGVL